MQTFLPYQTFRDSASVLDNKRLNKQIVEAYQILLDIRKPVENRSKWKNHPAILMWDGYDAKLYQYIAQCINEYELRGGLKFQDIKSEMLKMQFGEIKDPPWLGDKLLHSSHKSNLLFKADYYNIYEWEEINLQYIPYVWPSFYKNFETKELTKEGVKSLIKGLKNRNLWKTQNFQWPGFNVELEISWDSWNPALLPSFS